VAALCRERLRVAPLPDAVFSTNGPTGLGVLRAFRDLGLNSPGDIAFVTFDDLTVDDLFRPAITTIVQPAYEIGFRAADILIGRVEETAKNGQSMTIRLPAALKVRDSSRARETHGGSENGVDCS